MEERVAGEHSLTVRDKPVVELPLLFMGGVEVVPHVDRTTRRTQTRDPQCRTVLIGEGFELVELIDVLAGDDHGDLRVAETCLGEVLEARTAIANDPGPRTASLTSAVAPSREICTST